VDRRIVPGRARSCRAARAGSATPSGWPRCGGAGLDLAGRSDLDQRDGLAAPRRGQGERVRPERLVQLVGHARQGAADAGADEPPDRADLRRGYRSADRDRQGRGPGQLTAHGLRQALRGEASQRGTERHGGQHRQHDRGEQQARVLHTARQEGPADHLGLPGVGPSGLTCRRAGRLRGNSGQERRPDLNGYPSVSTPLYRCSAGQARYRLRTVAPRSLRTGLPRGQPCSRMSVAYRLLRARTVYPVMHPIAERRRGLGFRRGRLRRPAHLHRWLAGPGRWSPCRPEMVGRAA